jgi:hypothetical protein
MSNFPPATELPTTDPQVILAFHGLMTFRYKNPSPQGPGFCEVAMHADAAKHDFSVKIFDLSNGSGSDPFNTFNFGPAGSASVEKFRLDAVNADPPDVKFYQPVNLQFGTEKEGTVVVPDPLDFRHVIDFEDEKFYGRDLQKNENLFRPKLILKTGVVVTLVRSSKKFKRQAPFDERLLGRIAQMAAAGIYLKPGGLVALRFGQQEVRLELKPTGKTLYLILFDNSCSTKVCKFNPNSPIKEERNDFFEYYKMFSVPEDAEEFELLLEDANVNASTKGRQEEEQVPREMKPGTAAYSEVAGSFSSLVDKESNNEAPCGPGAFGGG